MESQSVTCSLNHFANCFPVSRLLYCYIELFGSEPVNHIWLVTSAQLAKFLCRKWQRIQLFSTSHPVSLGGYQRVSGEVLVSVNVMGRCFLWQVCLLLIRVHPSPDLLGAERRPLVGSASLSRPNPHRNKVAAGLPPASVPRTTWPNKPLGFHLFMVRWFTST